MKKILLMTVCLYLSLTAQAFCAENQNIPMQSSVNQKACQNVFSFINIDFSMMSPRGTAADVSVNESISTNSKKDNNIEPIASKQEKPAPKEQKNRTSLFRIDLLHIFKIQIL